jgi:DNA-binding response OmpR family regulator
MQVVFVIAPDWTLRTAVRAELRELGIKALGMESADDVGRALGAGEKPSAILLEAVSQLGADPAIRNLVSHVPTIVIASRTEKLDLPPVTAVLYRPVRIAEILNRIRELLQQPRLA